MSGSHGKQNGPAVLFAGLTWVKQLVPENASLQSVEPGSETLHGHKFWENSAAPLNIPLPVNNDPNVQDEMSWSNSVLPANI
jgi:hypothetical protein